MRIRLRGIPGNDDLSMMEGHKFSLISGAFYYA